MINNSFSDWYKKVLINTENNIKDVWFKETKEFDVLVEIMKNANGSLKELFITYWLTVSLILEVISKTDMSSMLEDRKWAYAWMSASLKETLLASIKIAASYGKHRASIEDFLIALIRKNSFFNRILEYVWINPSDIENYLVDFTKNGSIDWINSKKDSQGNDDSTDKIISALMDSLWAEEWEESTPFDINSPSQQDEVKENSMTPALDFFSTNLTLEAKNWKLDKVIWRDKEVERLIAILNRKTKNNPVLVWEPWVWKTAVVEGLAERICAWDVPMSMKDKKILSLDMSSLVAGTKYRWEFESRIKQIIEEASKVENEIILFIDEIHTIIWAWWSEWTLDASNILKPAMWRGKISVIWATTLNEYQKYIEKDSALERRFQKIIVDEPTRQTALEIITGIKEVFEEYHNLIITPEALEESVKLSTRYINDKFLPDKAIDLIDEACSLKSMKYNINEDEIKKLKEQSLALQKQIENAVITQSYQRASSLKEDQKKIEDKILEKKNKFSIPKSKRFKVWKEDIRRVLSISTWIPVNDLDKWDSDKLKNLEKELKKQIIGQNEAVEAVVSSIMRSKAWIASPDRPLWSFLFLGPTWVWKTELVKALARTFYMDEKALIKIDMSEYNDKTWVSKLVWASAWYVWYEEGGNLTEKVRKKPYSIVLFDEIEKWDFEVYNLLLQILDEWQLTDWKWRTVSFRNTIVIMTSNIGQEEFNKKAVKIWFDVEEEKQEKVMKDYEEEKQNIIDNLTEYFAPEFVNRIDKISVFSPLDKKAIKDIVKLNLEELSSRLKEKNITLDYDNKAINFISKEVYNPEFGAREIRRFVQTKIEDKIANMLILWKINDKISLSIDKKELKINNK